MPPTALLVVALIAYSIHEHQLGYVKSVEVWLTSEHVTLQDDGRGMGLDRDGYVQSLLGTLVGQTSHVRLHGIGLSMVAAVTPRLEIESRRSGSLWKQSFELGVSSGAPSQATGALEKGTRITLTGLSPLSEAGAASLAAQCEVWQSAHPGLTIVVHGYP